MSSSRQFSGGAALAVVIANMVGTGVFTSLGFQLLEIQSGFALILLWVVGGVVALCGALSYAELAGTFPRSGGEYNFLTQTVHPGAGFVSGWISATIGFAAPTALVAMTFGQYLGAVWPALPAKWLAGLLVVSLAVLHSINHRSSSNVQSSFTVLKVLLIVVFCVAALVSVSDFQAISFWPAEGDWQVIGSGAFAVSLIYVSYAYTGWNAATYLISEMEQPQRSLVWVLVGGTVLVMLLYLALNATFLLTTPIAAMSGRLEVGFVAAEASFGPSGGHVMGVMLALLLVSTVSAMLLAGPRVLHVIGCDFSTFALLARTNRHGIPVVAVVSQAGLALGFIASGTFEQVLVFAGFTLALNSFATVAGLLWVRWQRPTLARPFRSPLYPLAPAIYLLVTAWTLAYVLGQRPVEALAGLGIVSAGAVMYWFSKPTDVAQSTSMGDVE